MRLALHSSLALSLLLALPACHGRDSAPAATEAATAASETIPGAPFTVTSLARFDEPWAMAFLPDGRLLVTEKAGRLKLFDPASGKTGEIGGVPAVAYGGQGGLGDVALHPRHADNQLVYLSYAEAGEGDTRGAALARARLLLDADGNGQLQDLQVIWRQVPKVSGQGHYGHRIVFDGEGKLWLSSSERQKFNPAQDMGSNLGKILRLNDDGSVPADNPFAGQGEVAAQVWTLGHRNVLGMAFDADGQLWATEMGPKGGDEFNRIERGQNYGYPIVSNGDHYDGTDIPDHDTRPEFRAPLVSWTPVISPSSTIIYTGEAFPQWRGNALVSGLSSQSLVRVQIDGEAAREVERFDMGQRIRQVVQGPGGELWLIEDGKDGRLLKLQPKS